jgi:DNA-directed RNA polymerase subunit RPC12/RpoP
MNKETRILYISIYGDPNTHCAECKTPTVLYLLDWALRTDEDGDRYLLCPKCSGNDQR